MPENKEIEIRSDEVQEILSVVPNWMIRWGLSVVFGLILLVVFISWLIKYPDVIQGQLTLTTKKPSVKLVSQTNGYIKQLYFSDNTNIQKNQIIIQITNSIDKVTIDSLNFLLNDFQIENVEKILLRLEHFEALGEMQTEFNSLYNGLKEYNQITKDKKYYQNTLNNINLQIDYNNKLALLTKDQLDFLGQEINNGQEKFNIDSSLYEKGAISKYQFFNSQTEYIKKKENFFNVKKTYIQYKITVADFFKQENELKKNNEDKIRSIQTKIKLAINSIKSYTETWQQNYTIISPINGKLAYLDNITINQYIKAQ